MALPKIAIPTFELTQPSTGNKLNYRPFLVKEEKILLIAKESGEREDVFNAIRQIVNNCVVNEDFDIDDCPLFDLEYIFIKIRSKSVNNIVKFQVEDSSDEQTYDLEVDLNEVEITFPPGHEKKIMINDSVGVMMKYPTPTIGEKFKGLKTMTEVSHTTLLNCIDYVFDEEDVYPWDEESDTAKNEFIENLSVDAYNKIQVFFDTSPKIEHIVSYTNSQGREKKVVFSTLDDFFTMD